MSAAITLTAEQHKTLLPFWNGPGSRTPFEVSLIDGVLVFVSDAELTEDPSP